METSTFTNLFWIGGSIVLIGAFFIIKKARKEKKEASDRGVTSVIPIRKPEPSAKTDSKVAISNSSIDNVTSAKEGFISHLSVFSPILDSLRGEMDINAWQNAIMSTNNGELIRMWKQTKPQAWETILQMWGIKCEECSSFTAIQAYKGMYRVKDSSEIVIGEKYHVEKPCWILTTCNSENKTIKRVVKVGVVTKI